MTDSADLTPTIATKYTATTNNFYVQLDDTSINVKTESADAVTVHAASWTADSTQRRRSTTK